MKNAIQAESSIPTTFRKIKTVLTYPGSFFRYQSQPFRSFYHNFSKAAHFRTNARRCNAKSDAYSSGKLTIKEDDGYALFLPEQVPDNLAKEVVQEALSRIEKIDVEAVRKTSKKPYLLSLIKGEEIDRKSAIYKLVSHPEIVGSVGRYLKCFPVLTYIAVWYSPNLPGQQTGSQKYHLDHEDYRQIKAFMFIKDVGPQNGPFTLLPATESEKIQNAINYKMTPDDKQIDDEVAYEIVDRSLVKQMTGQAGSLALIDTSRCFHYGSREGTAPRIMLTFQYLTPFAYIMPWNWRKKSFLTHLRDPNMPEHERKLLGLDV